jgi:ribosomal protein S18 acetylase RimI-like enzyme
MSFGKGASNVLAKEGAQIPSRSWDLFGDAIGSYLGLELRATARASSISAAALEYAFMQYCELAGYCFDVVPTPHELAEHFHDSELIAVALDGDTLVGVSMGRLCPIPGTSRQALYASGAFTSPNVQRLGVASRLTYAMSALAFPDLFHGIFGMWNQTILCVTRTQTFSVYRLFRKTFGGVASIGVRPSPELQQAIDAVAKAFGWSLDNENIQRNAYPKRLSRHLVPTLGERDAVLLAGKYSWTLHSVVRIAFETVFPIRHMLYRSRYGRGKNHSDAQTVP